MMDNKIQKDQKPHCLLKSREQKQGTVCAPCTQYHLRGGQTTKAIPPANPWTHPLPSSHVKNKLTLPLEGCCYPCLVTKWCLTLVTPWGVARQAPLSMGCPRQEYWGGLLFPPPGDLPNPGIKPECPALAGRCFTTKPPGRARQPITCFCSPLLQQGPQ